MFLPEIGLKVGDGWISDIDVNIVSHTQISGRETLQSQKMYSQNHKIALHVYIMPNVCHA